MGSSELHNTRTQQHAAMGATRLTRASVDMPDTVVMLPNGEKLVLRRSKQPDSMPVFRKFNPKKFQQDSGKPHGKGTFSQARRIPFTKFLLTAFVLHQFVGWARSMWRRYQQRRNRQLVAAGEEEWEEEEQLPPDVVEADARLRQELLPAMMRAAMPKPQHRSKAQQLAHAHRARPRHVPTAGKMMRAGDQLKQKKPGMLEKMDKVMRQQVRDLVLAQEQAHQLQLEAAKRALALQGRSLPQLMGGNASQEGQAAARTGPVMEAASQPVRKR